MSDPIIYTCTPRKVRELVTDCIYAGLVPFIKSSPGVGKSDIVKSIAKELNLKLIDHRLSTSAPEDLSGLPRFTEAGTAEFAAFEELFPLDTTEIPEGYVGWLLFLDEFSSAKKEVQAAAYKLLLDRMTGQRHLHERVVIVCAGNLITDRAIVNPIGTAMQSRVVHLRMVVDYKEWLMDFALKEKVDSRIIAFLSQYPSKLMDFRADHNDETFSCPRTWFMANKAIKVIETLEGKEALFAGTITSGMAIDFINFTKVYKHLIPIKEVLADPVNCRLPTDNNGRWAMVSSMFEHVNEKNFSALAIYANRIPLDMRVLFFRFALVNHPELRQHPDFAPAVVELSNYLYD